MASPSVCLSRIAVVLTLATCSTAQSAEPQARGVLRLLTLERAVRVALRHNPSLAASVSQVKIAEARLKETRGADDFVLSSDASWSAARGETIPGGLLDDALWGLSLARPLPTGGSLRLRLGIEYARAEAGDGSGSTARWFLPSALLTLSHPLLRGLGRDVARADQRRARSGLEQAKLERHIAAAELLRSVVQSYWELAFATAQLRVRRSSLELALEQLRAVRANIQVGKHPPSAAAEVAVTVALRRDDVLQAEQQLAERSLELRQCLGLPGGGGDPTLVAADALEPSFLAEDLTAAIKAARQRNPQLQLARAHRAAATIELDVAGDGLLPQLDLAVTAGLLGSDADAATALAELGHLSGYQVQAGLTFSLPIERSAARGQSAAAHAGLRRARFIEEEVSLQVIAGVTRAMGRIRQARQRIAVLARATELATLDLEAEQARFRVGRSTNFDVLRRQDELARARLQQARAKTDYLLGAALLEALTGEILSRFGIEPAGPLSASGTGVPSSGHRPRALRSGPSQLSGS